MHVAQRASNNGHIRFIVNKIIIPSAQKNIQNIMQEDVNESGNDRINKYIKINRLPASFKEHDRINYHRINDKYSAPQSHKAHQNNYYGWITEINLIDVCIVINRRMEQDDKHKRQSS